MFPAPSLLGMLHRGVFRGKKRQRDHLRRRRERPVRRDGRTKGRLRVFAAAAGLTIVEQADALEGKKYAVVSAAVAIPLARMPIDRSYAAHMFVRKNRVVADLHVENADDGGFPAFAVRFFPTGRVTSDGWYEVATAVFSVEGARAAELTLSITASGADVDAFELVPEGAFKPSRACDLPFEGTCDRGDFCAAGWCRNGAASVPPLPSA